MQQAYYLLDLWAMLENILLAALVVFFLFGVTIALDRR
ncbi:hypothetical protein VDT1_4097 [Vibrio sp. 16]|nr:hypothetical protein VPMS16_3232 [Vibrio sp. 16]CAK4075603.1 hypothetical protein VDT1_4097 [Vibrio sp. 16]